MVSVASTASKLTARIAASAAQMGFTLLPFPIRVKLVTSSWGWSLFIQPVEHAEAGGDLVEWLRQWNPIRVEFGRRGVVRADFDILPSEWNELYRHVDLQSLHLRPDGTAEACVAGTRAHIAEFTRIVGAKGHEVRVRQLAASPQPLRLLTTAQEEALRAAIDAGYYEIPRPLNLHQLSEKLHVSSAALSERLRRAEARVIMWFVREGGKSPWEERALVAEAPSDIPAEPEALTAT